MISRELDSADSRFARICSSALAGRLLFVKTEDSRSELTSHAEEGPSRFSDFSTQSISIDIFD